MAKEKEQKPVLIRRGAYKVFRPIVEETFLRDDDSDDLWMRTKEPVRLKGGHMVIFRYKGPTTVK